MVPISHSAIAFAVGRGMWSDLCVYQLSKTVSLEEEQGIYYLGIETAAVALFDDVEIKSIAADLLEIRSRFVNRQYQQPPFCTDSV